MKKNKCPLRTIVALSLTFLAGNFARSQSNLPVYRVVQAGASFNQASNLASALRIPIEHLTFNNGAVSFVSSNFLRIPTIPLTDPATINTLSAQTSNRFPAIPLNFQATDFAALTNLPVLSSNTAVGLFSNALSSVP